MDTPARIILRRMLRKAGNDNYRPIFIRFQKVWYVSHLGSLEAPLELDADVSGLPLDEKIIRRWPLIEKHSHKLLALSEVEVDDIKKLLNLFGVVIHAAGTSYDNASMYIVSYDAFKAAFRFEGILGYVMEFTKYPKV